MNEIIFLLTIGMIWIIFATIQDLRKREVANWLNFSLIIFGLGFRFFHSLFSENFLFFYEGLIGLGIFFILGNLLYYGKMFAGGDAKLLIALGAILPLSTDFLANIRYFLVFLLIFFVIGAVYSLIVSSTYAIKNLKKFKKQFSSLFYRNKKLVYIPMFLGLILMMLGFLNMVLFILGVFIFILPYFYFYAKAVDEACMIKKVPVRELTEGDWLYRDIKIGKNKIKATWDGLKKKEIMLIKRNKKFVWVRKGIPFTPVFFFSFILFIYLYSKGRVLFGLI